MCTEACIRFAAQNLSGQEVQGKRVLDVGSLDVNGSLRTTIESLGAAEYIGVDIVGGPSVDIICPAEEIVKLFGKESFDTVVSTELLEHVEDWRLVISNIKNVCKASGIIIITTRSYGFPRHDYPFDFWRYELDDMKVIFSDCMIEKLETDGTAPGVLLKATRPRRFNEADLSRHKLFSTVTNTRTARIEIGDIRQHMGCVIRERDDLIKTQDTMIRERDDLIKTQDTMIRERDDLIKKQQGELLSLHRSALVRLHLAIRRIVVRMTS